MSRSAAIVLLGWSLLVGHAANSDQFETQTWPGEGVPVFAAIGEGLRLRSAPKSELKPYLIAYGAGWRVPFDTSILRTIRSVQLTVQKRSEVVVWCYGSVSHTFEIGDTVEYLQYRAEGFGTARVKDSICQIPLMVEGEIFGSDLPEPETEWWIRVTYEDGTSPGWLLFADGQVAITKREF